MKITDEQQAALQTLAAKDAIRQCLATHARAIDRADAELMKSIYHPDGAVDYGMFVGPIGEFADMLCSAQRAGPITLHRPSNVWIKVRGSKAIAESYVIAYFESKQESGDIQTLVGGRYLDQFEERDGEWKFTHRQYILEWNSNRPSTANLMDASFGGNHFFPLGAHGAKDPGNILLALHKSRAQDDLERKAPMTNKVDEGTIDNMLTRQELLELLTTYCRGVDRADEKLLATIFHDDATVVTGTYNGNGLDFAREITSWCRENTQCTFHSVTNQWFDIKGDSAIAESYIIGYTAAGAEGQVQDTIVGGRYLTRFERRDGQWKISEHTFVMDWNISQPSTAVFEGMFGEMTRGGRTPNDPVDTFWSSL